MRTVLAIGLTLLALSAAQAVDTVTCADSANDIAFSYDLDTGSDQPIVRVDMQLTGDFGFSTDPAHPKHDGEYVSAGFSQNDTEGGDVFWNEDDGNSHLAMSFRIGRAYHGAFHAIGGVVSVGGGGVWVVACRSSAFDQ